MKFIWIALTLVGLASVANAQGCTQIRFAPGTSSGEVRGTAPAEGCGCYYMDVGEGQRARVRVFSDSDAAVSVFGVADNREDVTWTTRAGRYELCVHRTFRAVQGTPFRMLVEVR